MIHATGAVRIGRAPEEAFDFVADLTNEPQFNPDASDVVKVTDGPIGLGTVYTENVRPLGRFEVRIDRYERPQTLGFDARNAKADIDVVFTFAPDGDAATLMRVELQMRPKGLLRLATPLLRPLMNRTMRRQRGPKIKAAVEALPARPA